MRESRQRASGMLLVVCGAGASYDSIPFRRPPDADPARPPLANELFEERTAFKTAWANFPSCQPIIPHLQSLPNGVSVEQVLSRLAAEAPRYPERTAQLAALRYYLQWVIWDCESSWRALAQGVTNYKTLVDRIKSRLESVGEVTYVTFNYDRLLDIALSETGRRLDTINSYIDNGGPMLIKPHGSIHWGRVVPVSLAEIRRNPNDVGSVANDVIKNFSRLPIQGHVLVDRRPPNVLDGCAVVPAIGVPLDTKSTFECPPEHIDALNRALPNVTSILTVGWRANELHFLNLLRQCIGRPVRVLAVAGGTEFATETIGKLEVAGIAGQMTPSALTFSESVKSQELDDFLAGSSSMPS